MANFEAKVTAVLDTGKIEQKLKNLGNTPIRLTNVTVNARQCARQIQAALNRTPITLSNIHVNPAAVRGQMQAAATAAGRDMERNIQRGMQQGATRGAREVQRQNQRTAREAQRQAERQQREFQRNLGRAQDFLSSTRPDANMKQMRANFEKIANSGNTRMTQRIQKNMNVLSEMQTRMVAAHESGDHRALVGYYSDYNKLLQRTQNQMRSVTGEMKQFASASKIGAAQSKMTAFLNSGTKAAKQYGDQVKLLQRELNNMARSGRVPASQLQRINEQFTQIQQSAKASGTNVATFGTKMKGAMSKFAGYIGASTIIYGGIRTIGAGISSVVELDNALVDLRKTSKATTSELNDFYYGANDIAKATGVSSKEIIQAAANWSRLGYSTKEEAETMAKVSSIFKTISPGMEIEQANDGLISAMKAFDISAEDALEGIASKINIIGNTQAVSNIDIVEMLTRSSSAMSAANNSLEETIALGTAATEITRDAASVGTAMKTGLCLYVQKCA